MEVIYVAGPYRDERGAWYIRQNIRRAEDVAARLWQMGYAVLTPHLNTALMDGLLPDEAWLAGGMELLSRADILVLVPGWDLSAGAVAERIAAEKMGKQVYEWREGVQNLWTVERSKAL